MPKLEKTIVEAKLVVMSLNFYTSVLDVILLFVLFAMFSYLLDMSLVWPLILSITGGLIGLLIRTYKVDVIRSLKGRYGHLDEMVLTALENKDKDNIIVRGLVRDASDSMDHVEATNFFQTSAVTERVASIILVSFLFLTVIAVDLKTVAIDAYDLVIHDERVKRTVDEFGDEASSGMQALFGDRWEQSNWTTDQEKDKLGAESGGETPGISEGPLPGRGGGIGSEAQGDLYGDASSASLAGKDVNFQLHLEYGGDIEIRETGGEKKRPTFSIDDVQSVQECADCVVGPENEEMVRKYFEKILQT